jgi:hypothetical protein
MLLVIGLVLKVRRDKTAAHPSQPGGDKEKGFSEGIGQYRLQLGRGDAD